MAEDVAWNRNYPLVTDFIPNHGFVHDVVSAKQFEVREARTTGSLVKGVRRRFWGK